MVPNMNISYQYSYLKSLSPTKGDQINEINTISALSEFADVYYGINAKMAKRAHISIIRANKQAFREAKGKRLWMASPYDKQMFTKADLIFTFTDTWTKWLREGKKFSLNPDGIAWGDKVVTFPQTIGSGFTFQRKQPWEVGGMLKIGIFGRKAASTYPAAFMDNLDYFKKQFRLNLIQGYNNDGEKKISYSAMPNTIKFCDIILVGQHGAEWEFCGNIKPLEAAACGIPVILERSEARELTFGKNYDGFVERGTMQSNRTAAKKAIRDRIRFFMGVHPYIENVLANASQKHRIEHTSKVLEEILKGLL